MDAVTKVAQAVLYEGYILWPYRRSALKNRQRWTFGGVHPRAYSEAGHPDDRWRMRTECLLDAGPGATIDVRVRFLHVVERRVARADGDSLEWADELRVDGERYLSWDEATEREIVLSGLPVAGLAAPHRGPVEVPAGSETEWLADGTGHRVGALVRSWRPLRGRVEVRATRLEERCFRVTVEVTNRSAWDGGSREDALRQTFASTHAILEAHGGGWVSLTDPPPALREAAEACDNQGAWPVLAGEEGEAHTILASPIILPDYPQIAPESPGDLFDGGEIDQMLILNILSLTDDEKEEMCASDPRAREILTRCASLSPEELMRLHGAIREFRPLLAQGENR